MPLFNTAKNRGLFNTLAEKQVFEFEIVSTPTNVLVSTFLFVRSYFSIGLFFSIGLHAELLSNEKAAVSIQEPHTPFKLLLLIL